MITLSAVFAAVAIGFSGLGGGSQPVYREIKGVQEFSGRMIARPLQMADALAKGTSYAQALAQHEKAVELVSGLTVKYVQATDEYIIRVPKGSDENTVSAQLMSEGVFQYVEPDWIVYPTVIPNDTRYGELWAHTKIQSPLGWDLFRGSNSVIIAVTDTGVRLDHEDFAGALVSGYNSASGVSQANGGDVSDINGHGTHTAGTAGAQGNNAKGVVGAGWNFKIMPIRVTNSPGGSSSIAWLTDGARWAADNGARIVSTSYSGVSAASVQTTGNYIKTQRNGIYVWAAGNSNTNLNTFDHPDVTIVGASDQSDLKASFSSYGPAVDVFAPGVNILSTYYSSPTSYAYMDGTSMATPLASSVAAMIIGTNPAAITGADAEAVLYGSTDDLGAPGNDNTFGWGRVNLNKAVRKAYTDFPFWTTSSIAGSYTSIANPIANAQRSDDVYQTYEPTARNTRSISAEYRGNTTLLAVGAVRLTVESHADGAGFSQGLDMYDFVSNSWVTVDTRPITVTDMVVSLVPANSSRYVQAGTGLMRARLRMFVTTSNVGFKSYVDRVAWTTTP